MRVLGIDCGTAITGWAILESKNYSEPQLISCGIITTHKYSPEEDRLKDLGESIAELIKEYQPDEMAIEDIFFFKNAKTVIKVSQARGVVIYEGVRNSLAIHSYTPLQIKQTITGHGRADKKQMMTMVAKLVNLPVIKQDDAADAIAVGYSHIRRSL